MTKTACKLAGILALVLSVFAISPLSPAFAAAGTAYAQTGGSHAATPTSAVQANPRVCTYGASSGNVQTCMSWSNSGTHINDIIGSALVINQARTIEVCIRGTAGTLKCDSQGFINIRAGTSLSTIWSPNKTEPAGTYCVYTWRENGDKSTTLIGDVCTTISPA